jgi:hypothetical protein
MVAEGGIVAIGRIGSDVGAAHEMMRKRQIKQSPVLIVMCERMELILLDLRLSLNDNKLKTILMSSAGQPTHNKFKT